MELRKFIKNVIFGILGIVSITILILMLIPAVAKTIIVVLLVGGISLFVWLLNYIVNKGYKE